MTGEGGPVRFFGAPEPEPESVTLQMTFDGVTVQGTLDAVGGDLVLARQALDAELAKDSPRSTLVEALERIVG
jgi:hypothetical protein